MEKDYDIVIVGAGASGLLAASAASGRGVRVLMLEKKERAGRKLLITGKGRCNITNTASMPEFYKKIYPNGRFLKHAFSAFFSTEITAMLNARGVETVEERGGRVFPASNSAADVVKALIVQVEKSGVEVNYHTRVARISSGNDGVTGIEIRDNNGTRSIKAKKVIICAGGSSYPATGSDGDGIRLAAAAGHTVRPVLPALVPLESTHPAIEALQGLSLKNVKAALWIDGKKKHEEFGEMLFTHFGLSGPIILTLSRFATQALAQRSKVEVTIDLKPALNEQQLDLRLQRDLAANGKKQAGNLMKLWLPSKMADYFISATATDPTREGHQISAVERKRILLLMKEMRFTISGHRPFREAIITAGGVACDEVDPKTMESRIMKGLYFAGEVLDLDADTGGYNLQIAWSTGWLAGQSAAAAIQEAR